jgi:hypothetical protein
VPDYNPFADEGEPSSSTEDPAYGGQVPDGQPTDQQQEPEYTDKAYLDIDDDLAQRYVRVKVDGVDEEVPLREALSGYSRQADYTRKTQELAQQRQQAEYALTVQRALQSQPEETLRLLARQHGVQFEQSPPPYMGREQPSDDDGYAPSPYADPIEARLNQQQQMIEQMMSQQAQRQADETLRAAIGGLQQRYQLDEATVREVVGTALQARMGPESFDMIYKNIAFDRAQSARAQAQAQRQAQEAQRGARGAVASQLIGNGSSANGAGGQLPGPPDGRLSLSEAYDLAERELGYS